MRWPVEARDAVLGLAAMMLIGVGCASSASLSPDQRVQAEGLVVERAAQASVELSEEDRDCVVDAMEPTDLDGLLDDQVRPVAEALVGCVGDDLIGASLLRAPAGEISEASLACAVDELDQRFVVDLVAGAMTGTQPLVQAEIELARVLAVCLELDELL